jgi:hypothetical protein
MTNNWQFIGEVIHVATKPVGRANVTTVVLRRQDGDIQTARDTLAACEVWNASGPAVGDVIVAYGSISSREYQGKHYVSLRVDRWHRIALAEAAAAPKRQAPSAPAAPAPATEATDEVPF